MSEPDRDPKALGDAAFDAELAAIFHEARGRDIPVGLHGRTVRSIEGAHRGPTRWFARLAGVGVVGAIVIAVGATALPWLQRSGFPIVASSPTSTPTDTRAAVLPSSSVESTPPVPAPTPTPDSSATLAADQSGSVTVMALGPGDVTLDVAEIGTQKIACGEGHGFAGNGPFPWHAQAIDANGASVSFQIPAGRHVWAIERPGGWVTTETPPKQGSLFAFCTTTIAGASADRRVTWNEMTAKAVGTPADAKITAAIKRAVDDRLQYLRDWVASTPGMTATFQSRVALLELPVPASASAGDDARRYLGQGSLAPGLAAVEIGYTVEVPQANHGPYWTDVLVFDLRDGHRIGIEELFVNPAGGLALLSDRARGDATLSMFGKDAVWTEGTAPKATNFSMWAPTASGLEITFAANQVGPSALGMPRIVVPWSAIEPLLKADSPVRNVVP